MDKIGSGAAVVYRGKEEIASRARYFQGLDLTNNRLEYEGLLLALELARDLGATNLEVYGDSELVVRQVRGEYRALKDHLRELRDRCWQEAAQFERILIRETPKGKKGRRRDNNERADDIAGKCMDLRADLRSLDFDPSIILTQKQYDFIERCPALG